MSKYRWNGDAARTRPWRPFQAVQGTAGRFRFGDIEVDTAAHRLCRDGVRQPLEPKAFGVLLVLLQRPGQLVSNDCRAISSPTMRWVTPLSSP